MRRSAQGNQRVRRHATCVGVNACQRADTRGWKHGADLMRSRAGASLWRADFYPPPEAPRRRFSIATLAVVVSAAALVLGWAVPQTASAPAPGPASVGAITAMTNLGAIG